MRTAGALLVVFVLLVSPAADAAGSTRHSGTVVAIDPQRGVLIIEEIGPGSGEKSIVMRRTITLTPSTKFNTFIRVNAPESFAGDFIEVALDADDLSPGEFVTAECTLEGGRLVAVRITRAELVQLRSSPGADRP